MDYTLCTGRKDVTIDAKNRLSIPSQFRSRMDPERDGTGFYVVPRSLHLLTGREISTLWLYANRYYERKESRRAPESIEDDDLDRYDKSTFARVEALEVDKQGRVLLPDQMLRDEQIGREVTITGSRDHYVIWNREDYLEFDEEAKRNRREIEVRAKAAQAQRGVDRPKSS